LTDCLETLNPTNAQIKTKVGFKFYIDFSGDDVVAAADKLHSQLMGLKLRPVRVCACLCVRASLVTAFDWPYLQKQRHSFLQTTNQTKTEQ
jgi:hypothetical protein